MAHGLLSSRARSDYDPSRDEEEARLSPRTLSLSLLLSALLASSAAAQTTIRVPADQPTIQSGIGAAAPGDTVLVAPGTYVERINFSGKAITVTSETGPAGTVFALSENATSIQWLIRRAVESQSGQAIYHSKDGAATLGNPDLAPTLTFEF